MLWRRRETRGRPAFDPARSDWTAVAAPFYFLEPWCGEFTPDGEGSVVIQFSGADHRHRGLEVDFWPDGKGVSLWLPEGARIYWRPNAVPEQSNTPWETRLRELDPFTCAYLDG